MIPPNNAKLIPADVSMYASPAEPRGGRFPHASDVVRIDTSDQPKTPPAVRSRAWDVIGDEGT